MNDKELIQKFKGLNSSQVLEKQKLEGYNDLPSSKPKNLFMIAFGVIKEPMFILLIVCGSLYLVLGDLSEGLMLLSFVFVIMGIELYQERKTEKALSALKDLSSPRALVLRDGLEKRVAGKDLVRGDIIILQEGDRVPADALVLHSINLMADESLLSGESVPLKKSGNKDLVFSGSMVVKGYGVVLVKEIGINTELGKIGKSLDSIKEEPHGIQKDMAVLVKRLTLIGLALCLIVVVAYTITRASLINGFLAGITLAMAMLPEEFPVVLTIFLALGVWRMSKKKVLTRKPFAIETLGSVTVLCSDKTGTITKNKMTVSKLFNGEKFFTLKKDKNLDEDFHEIVEYGILSCQTNPFDPMEKAILNIGDEYLSLTGHIHSDWTMLKEYPLSYDMLAMSRAFSSADGDEKIIATKGAPESIFDLCHLNNDRREFLFEAVHELASSGYRVLAVAKSKSLLKKLPDIQHDFEFEFVGLFGLSDPVREGIKESVEDAHRAGIRVIMITGDYPITATNVAKEIGIKNSNFCITGKELGEMSDEELSFKIKEVNVFARVKPEQKLKIINALKLNKEIVAMTGDGVNDAPALKAAHIGIAMGERGTDVARESASLVLLDDNFSSIVEAIKMGRRIFDNLQKAIAYIFAIHVPIAGLSLIPILFGKLPLVLWPIHVVFLELIIDPACSIIYEAEKAENNIMRRAPKNINDSFFNNKKILLSCLQGLNILFIVSVVYFVAMFLSYNENVIRAMCFSTLIVANIGVIFSNRSWTKNIFQIVATKNKSAIWIVSGSLFFLILILNNNFFLKLFKFDHISLLNFMFCFIAGLASIIWFELYKIKKLRKVY